MEGVTAIIIALLVLGGPLGAALLLNVRDRRERRLLQAVLDCLNGRELRGRVAVEVRCGLLSPRGLVRVHLLAATRSEIWELLGRLAERVPSRVRLEVRGPMEQPALATFTLEPARAGATR
ncbi:MAG: hypothetical protein HY725_07035 [Candidatus Rokubacteria bacterium]|nr:hypothetical protein [Candidatus Rokubacteria bacterium]